MSVDWVQIPSPILKKARKAKGLSYESGRLVRAATPLISSPAGAAANAETVARIQAEQRSKVNPPK